MAISHKHFYLSQAFLWQAVSPLRAASLGQQQQQLPPQGFTLAVPQPSQEDIEWFLRANADCLRVGAVSLLE